MHEDVIGTYQGKTLFGDAGFTPALVAGLAESAVKHGKTSQRRCVELSAPYRNSRHATEAYEVIADDSGLPLGVLIAARYRWIFRAVGSARYPDLRPWGEVLLRNRRCTLCTRPGLYVSNEQRFCRAHIGAA
jgi:hypothetical protein